MNPPATCPQCGAPLRTGTLGGLCPECVKRVAMAEPTLAGDDTSPPAKWTPPTAADLAALLPPGDYTVESFVGRGGMGAVYKGTQLRLERTVAIKVMCRDQGVDAAFIERFHSEALMLAKLNHPNIVNVIDCGEAGAELLYIVMEFVDGADVMQVIRDGGMTQEMALQIVPQICDALQFAHDYGVIHRDIKPSNILLTRDGRIKIADFGLAKRLDLEGDLQTRAGTGMGTPEYAAPEQLSAGANVDHRADIYALGVMMYQMLTGQLPRGAWQPPSNTAAVHPQWDEIVNHAMQAKPDDRYASAMEVKTDVSRIGVPPAPAPVPLWKKAAFAVALVVIIGAGAFFLSDAMGKKPGAAVSQTPGVVAPGAGRMESNGSLVFRGHRYRFMPGKYSWEVAKVAAERMGGHLATITSQEENDAVDAAFGKILSGHWWHCWLGGFRENKESPWQWVTGEPFAFHDWSTSGPEVSVFPSRICLFHPESAPNRVWVRWSAGSYDEDGNGNWRGFIVEWENEKPLAGAASPGPARTEGEYTLIFGGHRYELVPAMHTWEQARDEAVQRGGHLVTITSREESDAIIAAFSRHLNDTYASIFLGGSRRDANTSWEWCNGEPFVFTDWHEGEPNWDSFPAYSCLWRPSPKVDWFNWDDSPNWHGAFNVGRGFIIEWDGEKLPAPKTGSPVAASKDAPFVNSLGMKFVPVTTAPDGGAVLFSVWETRNRDHAAFAAAVPGVNITWKNTAGLPTSPDHPAATTSWVDAVNFCQWLTDHERAKGIIGPYDIYRLPTDLEWSTAASLKNEPGSTPKERHLKAPGYSWGTALPPPPGAGNFADDSALEIPAGDPLRSLPGYEYVANDHLPGYRDGWPVTSPVGSFAPDALGLYDLFGNVWEWCSDLSNGIEPGNTRRVLRGGSWANGQHDGGSLQTSHRGSVAPWERHPTLGFRAVLEIAR